MRKLNRRRVCTGVVAALVCYLPTQARAQWTIQDISAGNSGWEISTAMDYAGGLHVGYYNSGGTFGISDKIGSAWTARPAVAAGAVDLAISRRNQVGAAAVQY